VTDVVTPETRSRMMSGIRGKNTKPELRVRKALHARGFRFRLHLKDLPGKPDIVLPKYKAIILINGCFWHMHDCHLFKWPSTRPNFWREKISGNKIKDGDNLNLLRYRGWRILTIWECAIKGKGKLNFDDLIKQIINWIIEGPPLKEIQGRDEK
jgi:DNA mismatch endonuclease (patch repair protein)